MLQTNTPNARDALLVEKLDTSSYRHAKYKHAVQVVQAMSFKDSDR